VDLHKPRAGGQPQPSPAEMEGRFVAFIPLSEETIKGQNGQPDKQGITCNVVVFGNGEPFEYGATEGRMGGAARPAQCRVTLPYLIEGGVYSQQEIMRAIRPYVGRPNSAVLGVITKGTQGTKGNPPWLLTMLEDNDPRWQVAADFFNKLAAGQIVLAPPVPINQGGTVGQAQYTAPPVNQPANYTQAAPPATQAAYTAPAGPPRPAAIPEAAWAVMTPEAQAAASAAMMPPSAPAAPAFNLDVPPAGFETAWPYMGPAERQKAWESTVQPTH